MRGGDRRGVAWDDRFGNKVRGDRLRRDFYTGALTVDPDPMHPQDMVVPPGPDGVGRPFVPGPMHAIPDDQLIGIDSVDAVTFERVPWPRLAFNPAIQFVAEDF